jgi:hypothetical protein
LGATISQYRCTVAAAAGTVTEAKVAIGGRRAEPLPALMTVCAADMFTIAITAVPLLADCKSRRAAGAATVLAVPTRTAAGDGAAAVAAVVAEALAAHSSICTRMKGGMTRADGA